MVDAERRPFGERLRKRIGRDVDPGITLKGDQRGERPPSSTSSKILERLSSRGLRETRYRLDGEIARGGMGVILAVWDEDLRRQLAMKVVLDREHGERARAEEISPETLGRFLEEAQITGQLDHPGIVPVHELGLDPSGHVYFTMRLVKGQDLVQVFRRVRSAQEDWTTTRVLGLLRKACEAVAYAHAKGVIHRDLKPANVMVGRFGEVYVMDWGLARVLGEEHDARSSSMLVMSELRAEGSDGPLTADGQVFGTPSFMSPEQARGEPLDERTDVYAMGAMLYHLLSGSMPYVPKGESVSAGEVLARLKAGPPEPVTALAPDTPPELVALVEKAMAPEREGRYDDMSALAEDLGAYLEGRVVRAYETGAAAEFKKWVQRNRGMAAAIAATFLAVLAGLTSTSVVQARANDELGVSADLARDAAARAEVEAATSRAVVDFLSGMFELTDPTRARGETITVKEVLDAAARDVGERLAGQPEVRARMVATMGGVYRSLGLYDEAEPLLAEAAALEGSPAARLSLAELHVDQGRYETAEAELRALLDAPEQAGPDTLAARARTSLAKAQKDTGRTQEAGESLQLALAAYGAAGLDASPESLAAESLLVDVGGAGTTYEELETARAALVARAARALGPDHQTTLDLRVELAELYSRFGAFERAEPILDEVLARRRAVLGPEHPGTLAVADELSYLYYGAGRIQESVELYEETLAAAREALGDEHHDVLIVKNKLASVLKDAGRYDDARAMFTEALDGFERGFGADHLGTAATLNNIGLLEQTLGRFAEAEQAFLRALEIRRLHHGDDGYETLQSENNLALTYRSQRRYDESLPIAERVLDGYRRIFGRDHPESLTVLDNLAVNYYYVGRYEEARERLFEMVSTGAASLGNEHPVVARGRNNLGAILMQLERWDEALEQLELCRAGYEETLGPDHPDTVKALGHIAKIHLRHERYEEAEEALQRLYQADLASLGPQHPSTANALSLLATVYLATGRVEEAEASYREAHAQLAEAHDASHPATLDAQQGLAQSLARLGRADEALEQVDEILRLAPPSDPRREVLETLRDELLE